MGKIRCKKCKGRVNQLHYHTRSKDETYHHAKSYHIGYICIKCGSIFLFEKHKVLEIEEQNWEKVMKNEYK